jgi:hypothetical protein
MPFCHFIMVHPVVALARGGAVVKALRYKPEGRGIEVYCETKQKIPDGVRIFH